MLKIRLSRFGKKRAPSYRVVVADVEAPRDGRFVEQIGYFSPMTDPETYSVKEARALHWLSVGAQPTDAVRRLLVKQGTFDRLTRLRGGEEMDALIAEYEGVTVEELRAKNSPAPAPVVEEVVEAPAAEPVAEVEAVVEEIAAEPVAEPVVEEVAAAEPEVVEEVVEAVAEEPVVEEVVEAVAEEPVVEEVVEAVAEEPVVAEAAAVAAPVAVELVDDLTKVEGIGPKTAEVLAAAGIGTYSKLAETSVGRLKEILEAEGGTYAGMDPSTWPLQSDLAAAGNWDELTTMQDELVGGRPA